MNINKEIIEYFDFEESRAFDPQDGFMAECHSGIFLFLGCPSQAPYWDEEKLLVNDDGIYEDKSYELRFIKGRKDIESGSCSICFKTVNHYWLWENNNATSGWTCFDEEPLVDDVCPWEGPWIFNHKIK